MESREGRISSIMVKDVVTVLSATPIIEVSRLMLERNIRCIMVCDDRNLKGIVTDSDLVFSIAGKTEEFLNAPVSEVMTKDPVVVGPDADIYDVVNVMSKRGCRRVPVTKDGRVIGIVSVSDIVRTVLKSPKEVRAE